uniref:Transposase n=1 Tax=Steinernema glaseri TaxID=37863 RepID=A0A1I8AL85_9BILA
MRLAGVDTKAGLNCGSTSFRKATTPTDSFSPLPGMATLWFNNAFFTFDQLPITAYDAFQLLFKGYRQLSSVRTEARGYYSKKPMSRSDKSEALCPWKPVVDIGLSLVRCLHALLTLRATERLDKRGPIPNMEAAG